MKRAYKLAEKVMRQHEEARNSTKMLERRARRRESYKRYGKGPDEISDEQYKTLVSIPSLVRARRKIQNDEGRLVPTEKDVIKSRARKKERIIKWSRQAGLSDDDMQDILDKRGFTQASEA